MAIFLTCLWCSFGAYSCHSLLLAKQYSASQRFLFLFRGPVGSVLARKKHILTLHPPIYTCSHICKTQPKLTPPRRKYSFSCSISCLMCRTKQAPAAHCVEDVPYKALGSSVSDVRRLGMLLLSISKFLDPSNDRNTML